MLPRSPRAWWGPALAWAYSYFVDNLACFVQGICFIGKRDFSDFLRQYMPDAPGRVVLLDAHGNPKGAIATHRGCHFHTLGQRVRLGGRGGRTYVVGKDLASRTLYVVNDAAHAALATTAFHAARPQWTDAAAMTARLSAAAAPVPLAGRARHQQPLFACAAAGCGADDGAAHAPLYPGGTRVGFVPGTGSLWSLAVAPAGTALTVTVEGPPLQGMAPGQWLVLYDGEVCLGGATIVANVTEK
jgi:tRNA-specific 2-thiouridylase